MARDLYAVEAGSGFVEFRDLKGVSAALELIEFLRITIRCPVIM